MFASLACRHSIPIRSGLPLVLLVATLLPSNAGEAERSATVARTPGLIAFWDFIHSAQGRWIAYHDPTVTDHDYPVSLRRIGDPKSYTPTDWPYDDADSRLAITDGGPFGKAVHFNQGFVFAEVPRLAFDGTPLDLNGRHAFTVLAWTRFTGKRHLVAGVWDEGGWDRYGGRRQYALFGGLFGSQGVIAHISATGAASFPQSDVNGSQYARIKAIDARAFPNDRWVCMGMTYDPDKNEVGAWLDGVCTPRTFADPVMQDVTGAKGAEQVNPAPFAWPVFGPRAFLMKFNGYRRGNDDHIGEHAVHIDLDQGRLRYGRIADPTAGKKQVQIRIDLRRDGKTVLEHPITWDVDGDATREVKGLAIARIGDVVAASLWQEHATGTQMIGTEVTRTLSEGAPFTFGRALGLGAEERAHGSQLDLSGVAVFNRVLPAAEMQALSFSEK
jgi:hypothetical protein